MDKDEDVETMKRCGNGFERRWIITCKHLRVIEDLTGDEEELMVNEMHGNGV